LIFFRASVDFSLGLERTGGFETVAFCEIEPHPRRVLAKHWPDVPRYEDVRTLTAARLAADGIAVDAICGGFPCQDISSAGSMRGLGEGTRSGLFRPMVSLIKDLRLGFAIFENVARLLSGPKEAPGLWFWEFLNSLAEIGYNAEWFCITAASVGAPHERDRVWIVAYPNEAQFKRGSISRRVYEEHANIGDARWGQDKPGVVRTLDGVPCQMDRLADLGNAVVPQIPQLIGNAILASLKERQVAEVRA
jgi:DNA (cytosine-5)-methyltransferase 1